ANNDTTTTRSPNYSNLTPCLDLENIRLIIIDAFPGEMAALRQADFIIGVSESSHLNSGRTQLLMNLCVTLIQVLGR
ncbi:hypothetical protein CVT25_012622, partial [Psilocybe cyanescens]